MKKWNLVDTAAMPDGKRLSLVEHDGDYYVRVDGAELMSTRRHASEEKLAELAKTDKDPSLRAEAIKSLGLMGDNGRSDVLVGIYKSDTDVKVKHAVLQALFLQQNGKALVDLARSEKDPAMKQEIVNKMALVHTKETTDYMMEILK